YSKEDIVTEFKEMKNELKEYYASYSEQQEDSKGELEKDKKFEEELEQEEAEDKKDDADKKDEEENKESETIQTLEEGIDGQVITDEEEAEKQQGTSGDADAGDVDTAGGDARPIADPHPVTAAGPADTTDTADTTSGAPTIAGADTATDYSEKYEELKVEFDTLKAELEEL